MLTSLDRADTALNLRSQDRRELLSRWGFNCTCPLCHSARASSLSDRNRNRIQDILDVLHEEPNRDPPEYVELLSEEVFSLVYEEGLKAQSGEFDAVMSHVWLEMSGDRDRSGARGGKDDSRAGSAQGQSKAGKQSGGGQSGGGLVDKFSASNRGGKGGRWNGRGIGEEERQRRRQKSREHAARAVKVRGWYSGEESEFTERARRFLEKNFGEV